MRIILLTLIFIFGFTSSVSAQVVINEISSDTSQDWIELYAFEDTDISGWILDDYNTASYLEKFPENTQVGPAHKQYLEIDVGSRLNNKGDTVTLTDKEGNQVDIFSYGDKGGVCAPVAQASVGRYPDANSVVERFSSATKGTTNDMAQVNPCPTPTEIAENTPNPTPTPKPTNIPTAAKKPTEASTSKTEVKSQTSAIESTPIPVTQESDRKEKIVSFVDNEIPKPTPVVMGENVKNFSWTGVSLIGIGVLCVGGAFYPLLRKSKKSYNLGHGESGEKE